MPFFSAGLGGLGAHAVDRVYRATLPANPEAASMMSLDAIHALAREGREDPVVRRAAFLIVRQAGVREKDFRGMIVAIHRWIQQHLFYMHDPAGVEMLTQARVLLRQVESGEAVEDCDSFVLLEHALLNSVGVATRSVIWKADARAPDQWSHITLEAFDGKGWVPLDPIMKDKPPGWAPPRYYAKRVVPVGDGPPFPAGLRGRFDVAVFPRGQSRETLAGFCGGSANLVGWGGFAGYGDAAVAPAPPVPPAQATAQRTLEGEIRELRRIRDEALSYTLPLLQATEPLVATMERAGQRIADRAKMLGQVNEIATWVGRVLTVAGYVVPVLQLVAIAVQVGNLAYQARQGAALVSGSAAKTLAEVGSALDAVSGGLAAAAEVAQTAEAMEQQRQRILGDRPRILHELAQEQAPVAALAVTTAGPSIPWVPLAAVAAGLLAVGAVR